MKDSINFILHNKYLGWIVLLVICYGISINLVEVAWKNQVGILLPNPSDKQAFFGNYSAISGIVHRCCHFDWWLINALVRMESGCLTYPYCYRSHRRYFLLFYDI